MDAFMLKVIFFLPLFSGKASWSNYSYDIWINGRKWLLKRSFTTVFVYHYAFLDPMVLV